MHRLSQAQRDHRQIVKQNLGNPAVATVPDLDDFLRDTRTNDYLFLKQESLHMDPVASSQCLTPKHRHKFEHEVSGDSRLDFLKETRRLARGQKDHAAPHIRAKAEELLKCCDVAEKATIQGLQATPRLKGIVAELRESMDESDGPAPSAAERAHLGAQRVRDAEERARMDLWRERL